MSERWHEIVRSKPGEAERELWVSTPEALPSDPDITLTYLSLKGSRSELVPDGIYVQTDVPASQYEASFDLRSAIRTQICLTLSAGQKVPSTSDGPELDLGNAMNIGLFALTADGSAMLKVDHVLPSEVDEALHNLGTGKAIGKYSPVEGQQQ